MLQVRPILIAATASSLLAACASSGGRDGVAADGGDLESEGIRTSSIGSAPATQQAHNHSRPLSEQNTPQAIAIRESQTATGIRAAPVPLAAAVPPALAASAPTYKHNASLQQGSKVHIRSGASLYSRPKLSSDSAPATIADAVELGSQIHNAGGYWWYVTAGTESGWLLQTDIASP